ncbi:MAG: hypothetical protein ACRCZO_18990 [Cetobacterium sp.]
MSLNRDLSKLSITIDSELAGKRTLTNIYDWSSGESPELGLLREADLKGNSGITIKHDKSGKPTITVKYGSQDQKFMDKVAIAKSLFKMAVIDESSSLYKKQYNGTDCLFDKVPDDTYREGDNITYTIISANFAKKAI